MDNMDIVIEDDRWHAMDIETLAKTAVQATLAHQGLDPEQTEISILACNDTRIADLNADFRGKPTPTNVLSWPSEERAAQRAGDKPRDLKPGLDGMIELGDIAISYDTCKIEAEAAGKPIQEHVTHLIVHGLLHLFGYDHIRDPDATLMEQLEVEILGKLGHDDPYREISAL
ncbi:rRNA maturation RNase YbeY [Sulfitobacter sp. SK011]|uniref:rRNA maturation RNase YbeY n=1 Tax=Sulfitobacter sp. SK011 TaxID=1389004 RepID=UPI000E0A6B3D|nr:rRNA maturation RNase YbeY [Sulfitobacter sp. SK011]AXI41273.1 rRNA maturation RNase YbeY [Sulfitobacter sp. SK011]